MKNQNKELEGLEVFHPSDKEELDYDWLSLCLDKIDSSKSKIKQKAVNESDDIEGMVNRYIEIFMEEVGLTKEETINFITDLRCPTEEELYFPEELSISPAGEEY